MNILEATDSVAWDTFLSAAKFRPFLQSFTMGEVYREIGQSPIRLTASEGGKTLGMCFAHVVPARRGKHLSVPYGPIFDSLLQDQDRKNVFEHLVNTLKEKAAEHNCAFIRMSPFFLEEAPKIPGAVSSPLHLLAEHVWYLPLVTEDPWKLPATRYPLPARTEDEILKEMRKTTRNLIRRAERDGVTIEASSDPERDLEIFLKLHEETRRRHTFTPYSTAFFRSQVKLFSKRNELTLYLAKFQGEVIATSIHMHAFGETGYHHGASSSAHSKIPASYLLQWRAIQDAMKRGDHVYNFWGIAPLLPDGTPDRSHPFAGVTLFKTGFGGSVFNLIHCFDIPVSKKYWLTYGFETFRKWRRGF